MTTVDITVKALHLLMASVSIWVLLSCWRSYRIDLFRERLFTLRDQLFDFAADGGIPFDHPAYAKLRATMNGMIRFAHRITFARLMITWCLLPEKPERAPDHLRDWMQAMEKLDSDDARRRLMEVHARMLALVVRHMWTGSPLLLGASALIVLYVAITRTIVRLTDAVVEVL